MGKEWFAKTPLIGKRGANGEIEYQPLETVVDGSNNQQADGERFSFLKGLGVTLLRPNQDSQPSAVPGT